MELSLCRKNISPAVSFRKLVNILVPSRCTVRTMHLNLKIIFLCAGKISIEQRVGIIAVRETTFSEPQRERERNILRVWVLTSMRNSPVTKSQLVDSLSYNTVSLLLGRLHARVSNQWAARLYFAPRGHVCKLCIYCKKLHSLGG